MTLSAVEAEVLQRCAASRVTVSAVKLAAEMYGDFDGHLLNQDITFDLVEYILRDLNEQGYIVYRISPEMHLKDDGTIAWVDSVRHQKGVPIHIRVTDEGYKAIGYTTKAVDVSRRRSYRGENPLRDGDMSDFRNHGFVARAYGLIERCHIDEHLRRYPSHAFTPGGF